MSDPTPFTQTSAGPSGARAGDAAPSIRFGEIAAEIAVGDVVPQADMDAVVLCATLEPLELGVAPYRLEQIGGAALVEECRRGLGSAIDRVVVTAPHGQAREALIHVPGPVPARHPLMRMLLEAAYERAFAAAERRGVRSLALEPLVEFSPPVMDEREGEIAGAVLARLASRGSGLRRIRFVFSPEHRTEEFEDALRAAAAGAMDGQTTAGNGHA